jgi:hypothetical protein
VGPDEDQLTSHFVLRSFFLSEPQSTHPVEGDEQTKPEASVDWNWLMVREQELAPTGPHAEREPVGALRLDAGSTRHVVGNGLRRHQPLVDWQKLLEPEPLTTRDA